MNLFALSGVLVAVVSTIVAGMAWFAQHPTRASRVWAAFALSVSVGGLGAVLIGLTRDAQQALIWWRIAHVGIILPPVLFYHFVTVFTERRNRLGLVLAYAVSAWFLGLDATPWFIPQVRPVFGGQFYYDQPVPTVYALFVAWFVGLSVLSHVELWRALQRTRQRARRLLIQWLLAATAIGFLGGTACFLPAFGLDVYPYGNFAVSLFPFIMAYAFLRYRLMDMSQALARGAIFLITYLLVLGVPLVVGHRFQATWQAVLGPSWWAAPVVLMGLLASASPWVLVSVSRRLEQRLWQAQRRYHRTLISASSGMTRIKDIQQLCRLIVRMVNRTVGLANASAFLYEPKEQRYAVRAVRYPSMFPSELSVSGEDPLVQMLQETKDLIKLEELQETAEQPSSPERSRAAHIYEWMRKLEARLIVPSFSNDRLLAFLVLGPKRSQEPYTTDDIAVFSGLANQAALAIENALFFEELQTNEAYMIQSEKLASLGQLASGMAHEIHNPLTIISGEAQLYLERFKAKDPEVDTLLFSIIEECRRAADITRRILRFAKPAPAEVAPVDLKTTVDESLTLAGYQVRLERVERTVEIPDGLPKVRSNQNQLQEVILNLILNACQAMGEQGGKLMLSAQPNGSHVVLKVADTGPGIPMSIQRKVFDPFYTTKPTGTGLGLFVSQRIVQSHGGTIELDSAEGKGTCFTIQLPVWQEAAGKANGTTA